MVLKNASDVLRICTKKDISIATLGIQYEVKNSDESADAIKSRMLNTYLQMKQSINNGLSSSESQLKGKMLDSDGKKIFEYQKSKNPLSGNTTAKAVAYALSVMDVNCSMGRIVAAPTAGSCGVLPATILSTTQTLGLDDAAAVDGLFVAGVVGVIIGRNASLAGAQGGCQAEVGSASAMAAAAIVSMAGGSAQMSFDGAAIALKNVLGLVCDPVAGLVEVPCAKRNAMGTANALISADMALSGIKSVIPFDEVVWAMDQIGQSMPTSLKETAEGGLAATPTAKRLRKEIFGE